MTLLRPASDRVIALSLTALRVVVGAVFLAHGAQKLFVFGLEGVTATFAQMGIPFAFIAAPLVVFTELVGGAALILGILTRVVAAGLVATMLGAFVFVHASAGFFGPAGYEFVLVLLTIASLFIVTGGGQLSVDAMLVRQPARVGQ